VYSISAPVSTPLLESFVVFVTQRLTGDLGDNLHAQGNLVEPTMILYFAGEVLLLCLVVLVCQFLPASFRHVKSSP
jgi:hypothetical protein